MKLKQWHNIFHVTVNANSIIQHVIQNEKRMAKHVNVSVKTIVSAEKTIVGILAHIFVRILRI